MLPVKLVQSTRDVLCSGLPAYLRRPVGRDLCAAVCTVLALCCTLCAGSDRRPVHAGDGPAVHAAMCDLSEPARDGSGSAYVLPSSDECGRLRRLWHLRQLWP